jgi:hypothetical protein
MDLNALSATSFDFSMRIFGFFRHSDLGLRVSGYFFIFLVLLCSSGVLRADLILEQQTSDSNHTSVAVLKLHGDKMRLDQPANALSVIIDLKTRDSITLLTTNKTYLLKFGSEVRWEMEEERKRSHHTNELDSPPTQPVPTGQSEIVNDHPAAIYTWSGAKGETETLWVATNFPNFDAIRVELAKLDHFNAAGPHRNAQPELARLPGMVVKSERVSKGHKATTTLVSVKVEPVEASLFALPADYAPWKRPAAKKP